MNLKKLKISKKIWWLIITLFLILAVQVLKNKGSFVDKSPQIFEDVDILHQAEAKSNEKIEKVAVLEESMSAEDKYKENLLTDFSGDVVFGNKNAPITVIEYSSFTCGYCVEMHNEIMDKLKEEYIDTNKVKFVHRAMVNQRTIFAKMLQHCVDSKDSLELTADLFNTSGQWAYSENILEQLQVLSSKYGTKKEKIKNRPQSKKKRNSKYN